MNHYIVKIINDSKWLYDDAIDFMDINHNTPEHIAIERIWLNVSVSFNTRWQNLLFATANDTKLYAGKIIVILLIKNILKDIYQLEEEDIDEFLGYNNILIIDEYFDYIKSKK
jgi:hypothetical protein